MKPSATKCECGRVSNPLHLMIVSNAWVDKKQIAYFEFPCPQCTAKNVVRVDWSGK